MNAPVKLSQFVTVPNRKGIVQLASQFWIENAKFSTLRPETQEEEQAAFNRWNDAADDVYLSTAADIDEAIAQLEVVICRDADNIDPKILPVFHNLLAGLRAIKAMQRAH